VAIQVHQRVRLAAGATADHIDPRMLAGVLRTPLGGDVGNLELARLQPVADEPSTWLVCVTGRIDRGNADEGGGEVDDLIGGLVDALGHPANDVGMQGHAPSSSLNTALGREQHIP
jgi:hypothetical protein